MIVELDSWYLPDTAATSYRAEHVKTLGDRRGDRPRRASGCATSTTPACYELDGEDYRGVFRLGRDRSPDVLPPYTELVRFDAGPRLHGAALREAARELLRRPPRPAPGDNPFERFGAPARAPTCPTCSTGDARRYHAYAFATVRMAGVGVRARRRARRLAARRGGRRRRPRRSRGSSTAARSSRFKLARRRAFDPQPRSPRRRGVGRGDDGPRCGRRLSA